LKLKEGRATSFRDVEALDRGCHQTQDTQTPRASFSLRKMNQKRNLRLKIATWCHTKTVKTTTL